MARSETNPPTDGPAPTGGRNHTVSHDPSSADLRAAVFEPLAEWLRLRLAGSDGARVLDFGCGDLLLARHLDGQIVVDGYDESALALASAAEVQRTLREPGERFARVDDIPVHAYDAVVVNSLFQYVADLDEAEVLFRQVATVLRPDPAVGAVVTDAVLEGANRLVDLIDVVRFTVGRVGWRDGLNATVQAIRSGRPARRHRHTRVGLEARARAAGLRLAPLDRNLTAFRRRTTFVLTPLSDASR